MKCSGCQHYPHAIGLCEADEQPACNCLVDDRIDASLAECCEGHAKFGVCYNDPENER